MSLSESSTCIIIGASHGGVTAAFAVRKEGWQGDIVVIDSDPTLPYHRPPLSKAYLTSDDSNHSLSLKPAASYEKNNITLLLGKRVDSIKRENNSVILDNGEVLHYKKIIIATGARPFIPPIQGIAQAANVFCLRTHDDVEKIRSAFSTSDKKRVVIIGGGYIGLETAASLKKLGGHVTVLEREPKLLARVTSPEMSAYFQQLHTSNGVIINTSKNVQSIESLGTSNLVHCDDDSNYPADIIIVGVGVRVNQELAEQAGLAVDIGLIKGVVVNEQCQTNDANIYAIGDCAYHHNPYYDRWLRLESVQNAVDQGKVAAASLCDKPACYSAIPWFWSDQFDVKLQMVGLATGYDNFVIRKEIDDENKFSVWYFLQDRLLAVDAINHAKAYVLGTKCLKVNANINKEVLADNTVELSSDIMLT
ncbi:NAD(P)/FAD-dependent oxidoreductase [Colwellia echini]|uniref:Oxidoreductase n=1 Tax=Colwellia echini TaxID=1982103 RepID=A0ABY3N1B6_9GAMM|nr:FAD-dependent oxidoreductase [Colwellia echini]TYK67240.1 oxidoreductase [Colwellia echini]